MSKLRLDYASIRRSIRSTMSPSPPPLSLPHTSKHHHPFNNNNNPLDPSHIISSNKTITHRYKTGDLEHARHLFDKMPQRTVVSYNIMITGYCNWGLFPEAVELIRLMHRSAVKMNETSFSKALSVCARAELLDGGREIHGLVMKCRYERFEFVGSSLLYLYASCCKIGDGRRVFDELVTENELLWSLMLVGYVQCGMLCEALGVFGRMPRRGVVEWTTLISGYAKSENECEKALEMFKMMRECSEVVPNEFTLDCAVRACSRLGYLWSGRVLHGLLIKLGFEFEFSVRGALMYFYVSCEVMEDAKRVYYGTVNPSLGDSNELILGLVKSGKIEEAELVFGKMTEKDPVTYNLLIKGYAICGRVEDSKKLFMEMPVRIIATLNTMISVYARNGEIEKAFELFEMAKGEGNPATWNSMVSGYIQNDQHENALKLYLAMHRSSISPTRSTFSVLFRACACLGSLQMGRLLHGHLEKTPFLSNAYVGTALIDMYSKCGYITDAQVAFRCISYPNVAAWTALINGYSQHSLGLDAVSLFNLMIQTGVLPNAATYVAVLSACARSGLVDDGMKYFHLMRKDYGITPTVEHITCVVELLGRSGLIREAEELIDGMSIEPDEYLLISILNSSWFWMDMKVAERIAEKMFRVDPSCSSACVIMSNMYSESEKWGEKMKLRDLLRQSGVKKDPGCSWINVSNKVVVFSVDDRNHPSCNMIHGTLESLRKVTRNMDSSIHIDFGSLYS